MKLFREILLTLEFIKRRNFSSIEKIVKSLDDNDIHAIKIENKKGEVMETLYIDRERGCSILIDGNKKINKNISCFDEIKYLLLV